MSFHVTCERCHQRFPEFDPRLMAVRGGRWRCKAPCHVPQADDYEDDETSEGHARHQERQDAREYAGVTAEDVREAVRRWR